MVPCLEKTRKGFSFNFLTFIVMSKCKQIKTAVYLFLECFFISGVKFSKIINLTRHPLVLLIVKAVLSTY